MFPYQAICYDLRYVDVMQTIPYIRENESGMIQAKPLPWHKSGGRVGPLHAFVVRQPWGDLLRLSALTDLELINLIEKASAELKGRLASSTQSDTVSVGSYEPVSECAASTSRLKKPWTCGYQCKWCPSACTRAEGHKNHSCYEHRHRR